MIKTVQIDDTLQEHVNDAIDELKDAIREYYQENPDIDDLCLSNDVDYDGRFSEIVDGNVPVYYSEIDGLFYLHGDKLEEAYASVGLGEEKLDNYKQVCIYHYIEAACWQWWNDTHQEFQGNLNNKRDELLDSDERDKVLIDFIKNTLEI